MALKFFWDAENSLTLSGTDYSSGDTTGTNTGTSFAAGAAKTGSYGVSCPITTTTNIAFTATNIWPSAGTPSASAGCVGFWAQPATGEFNNGQNLFRCFGSTTGDKISIEGSLTNAVSINCESVSGGGVLEVVSANNSNPAGAWRFIVGRWDIAGDKLAIEVYSDAGGGTLTPVSVVETTSLGLVAQSTAFATLQFAMHPASDTADDNYYDHFLISDAYAAPLQSNAFITDYANYSESAGHPAASRTRGIPGMSTIASPFGRGW